MHILDSLLAFSAYFLLAWLWWLFSVYLLQNYTAQRMAINQNNNTAASLAFSGTLLGYVIPLSSAAINAVSIPDYFARAGLHWWFSYSFCWCQTLYARIKRKIINHNTAAGMFMGTAALAGGILTQLVWHGNGRSWPENANQEITVKLVTERSVALEDRIILLSRAAIATHKILNVGANGRCRF